MYIGRFAPSPTGKLHLGSLFAAVASWLDARAAGGQWLIRIEDLDPPREELGASQHIIDTLAAYGLVSDQPIIFQSQRHEAYETALSTLQTTGQLFWCRCSRKQLAGLPSYPGTCFAYQSTRPDAAAKFRVDNSLSFNDRLQGPQDYPPCEPFVVRRRDKLWAYQLAVVVDDAFSGVTDVVRGIDLIDSTPMQIALQQALGLPTPTYAHLPVIVNPDGSKLSKQNLAQPISVNNKEEVLQNVLARLAIDVAQGPVEQMLKQAVLLWQPQRLRATTTQAL
ncbi:tRNA glutamyl-Q(34) synthetase GluQRS [Salinibius halmophilus]|uniref:tRNA glutamyl-Q(34) synthetase GluQRS n=1 Tax=Salinibius halmophilus TaxID=1853216 RepID=UPI000E675E74|nr:tRNA glutamyl-Q(34) synthetase GluQRS [Salinibius halmophilus]